MVVGVGVWDRGEFSIGLEQRLTESKLDLITIKKVSIILPSSTWVGVSSYRTQRYIFMWCITSGGMSTLCVLYFVARRSVLSDSLWPHGLYPTRILCPWGFSRQEYRGGLPCPPPGGLPNAGIKPRSPTWQEDSLPSEHQGSLYSALWLHYCLTSFSLSLHSFVPLRSLITEICWRARIAATLRSQDALGKNDFFMSQPM